MEANANIEAMGLLLRWVENEALNKFLLLNILKSHKMLGFLF